MRLEHRQNALALRHQVLEGKSVHLNQQVCGIVRRQGGLVGLGEGLGKQHRIPLHEFKCTRHGPCLKDGSHRLTSRCRRFERHQHECLVPGQRQQLERGPRDDAQRAFAPNHQLGQVVAGRILQGVGPRFEDRAVGEDHFQVQHPVLRDTVLHGTRTAAVLGNVPPNGARATRRGIHRIHQPVFGRRIGQLLGDDPRPNDGLVVHRVDRPNPVHPPHGKGDAPVDWKGATAQSCACTGRRDRHSMTVSPREDGGHFACGFWLHHHLWKKDQILGFIRGVRLQRFFAPMDSSFPHHGRQLFHGHLTEILGHGMGGDQVWVHERCVILGACQK